MARALRIDPHVRNSYYPIYAGSHSVNPPPAGSSEAQAFAAHFDDFLTNNLPSLLFTRGESSSSYGGTIRPAPGENSLIRINYKLSRAFELLERAGDNTAARLYVVLASTLMHELAHCYGFFCRPGNSPAGLSVPGYERERVQDTDDDGVVVMDEDGQARWVEIGEGGYVQEDHFAGGRLGIVVPESWREDWRAVTRVTLQVGKAGSYYEITLRECHEVMSRLRTATSHSFKLPAFPDPDQPGMLRCKAIEIATETHTSKDWSPSSSVKSRASDDGAMLLIGVTGHVRIEPYQNNVILADDQ